jgi:hypothetical protein
MEPDELVEIASGNVEEVVECVDSLVSEIPLDGVPEPINQVPDVGYFPASGSPKKCAL